MAIRGFAALVEALSAYVQGDDERLRGALLSAPAHLIYDHAIRHECGSLLFRALADPRPALGRIAALRARLQPDIAACQRDAVEFRIQLSGIVRAFKDAGVEFALLGGSAGIYAGDRAAEAAPLHGLGVLVPRKQGGAAVHALVVEGYHETVRDPAEDVFRTSLPSFKRPAEVRVQLAPDGCFSTQSDWGAFAAHFEAIEGAEGPALRLDAFGRCVRRMLRGARSQRIAEPVYMALELRRTPGLIDELIAVAQAETLQRAALQSVVCTAARIAAVSGTFDPAVQRFVRRSIRCEDLPPGVRAVAGALVLMRRGQTMER